MSLQTEVFLKLLEISKLNQKDFGKLTGKRPERLSEWKNEKYSPTIKQLELMADKLGYRLKFDLVKKNNVF
ncbi:helix-turn-helix transcriptional regulator [Flavobacterium sp.]|uniref:helix-turn-helix domain-containing protein n=1 Tax=Flavobacterium sp. TaxID=239 RepID=UPI0025BB4985|nr:helix-turn-helix transcriptional regulator [Flavobacterium sp.]MBA4155528.1 hypothetical protein [Flavobacterium sp.]